MTGAPTESRVDPAWEISARRLHAMLAEQPPQITLIDVRRPDEWSTCRIAGARHIPLDQLASQLPDLDRLDTQIILYCHHGVRSLRAAELLRRHGIDDAWSLAGGIDRWSTEIDPANRRY